MTMRMNMKRSRKSNRVSWAPGVNLCQVKLFSSEDCPVEAGLKYQDHFQAKASCKHSNSVESNDLPPGFEGSFAVGQSRVELSHIPRIQWQCPPKFVMSQKTQTWHVAAGEESEEAKDQKWREMRVLEALYPRFSSIPPSPFVSLDVEGDHYDDSLTPSVPLTPIEEEESPDFPSDLEKPVCTTVGSQPPGLPLGLSGSGTSDASKWNSPALSQLASEQPVLGQLPNQDADVTAAALAAFTAIMKSTEKGSLIDTGLLIKIISDPKMIQELVTEHGPQGNAGIASTNALTAPRRKTIIPPVPSPLPKSDMQWTANGNFCQMPGTVETTLNAIPPQLVSMLKRPAPAPAPAPAPSPSPPLSVTQSNPVMVPRLQNQLKPRTLSAMTQPNRAPLPSSFPVKEAGIVKDVNYYKNLIRQHGAEKHEPQDHHPIIAQNGNNHNHLMDLKILNCKPGELKPKNSKPCMYFKSSKGCRNGVNCSFQHDIDMSFQWRTGNFVEAQSVKRMKLSGLNTGRTL